MPIPANVQISYVVWVSDYFHLFIINASDNNCIWVDRIAKA